ncbi:MAG: glycosyltransferase family 2 protein, partial [Actinomyces graevenitzii]|nr:glycosyltransferase family 2 protein [Actinomyces graevenitzii]
MSVLTTKSLTQTIAILVTSGVSPYLNQTLTALALQTRTPQLTLVVNVEATSASTADLQALVQASGLTALSHTELINAPEAMNFGQAVARAVELIESGHYRSHVNTNTPLWLWLLHDDSAPQVDCLENLQSATANARSVAMAGPKQVDWDNPGKLLEVGLRVTASARRANEIVPGEIDQGQYDDRVDVLAVGSAGVLVDYHPFIKLGGFSEHFGPFGDGLELSKVMRLAGYRVIVVPEAVIRHRQASYLGLRGFGSNADAAVDASDDGAKLVTDAESAGSPDDVDDAQGAETA